MAARKRARGAGREGQGDSRGASATAAPVPERIRRARELREAILALPRPLFPKEAEGRFSVELAAYREARDKLLAADVDLRRRGLPRWHAQQHEDLTEAYLAAKDTLRAIVGREWAWLIFVDETVKRAEAATDPYECEALDEWVDGERSAVVYAEIREQGRQDARECASHDGAKGGRRGRGRPKRPHTTLIRRAADELEHAGRRATPAQIRHILSSDQLWRALAFELGDPLQDIVNINVRGAVVDVEYSENWTRRRRGRKRFIEIDDEALRQALKRRPTDQ